MKEVVYKNCDKLPLFLDAETVAKLLGVPLSSAYRLTHEPGFPVLLVVSRMVVPEEQLIQWGEHTVGRAKMNFFFQQRDPKQNRLLLPNDIWR